MNILKRNLAKLLIVMMFFTGTTVLAAPVPPEAPTPPGTTNQNVVAPKDQSTPTVEQPVVTAPTESANAPTATTVPSPTQEQVGAQNTEAPANQDQAQNSTQTTNEQTGNSSENLSKVEEKEETKVENNNQGTLNNDIGEKANSGDNSASYNTGDGNIATGDASSTLALLNMLNTNITALPGGSTVFFCKNIFSSLFGDYLFDPNSGEVYDLNGARIGNLSTGANSNNTSNLDSATNLLLNNSNNGTINNTLNLGANTGSNMASYNTGNGSIQTGNANVSLNLINMLNTNLVASAQGVFGLVNIFGNWIGNLILGANYFDGNQPVTVEANNSNTGANSVNSAITNINHATGIDNSNVGEIQNNLNLNANTGQNGAAFNTGDGNVATGNSQLAANIKNFLNQNIVGDSVYMVLVNVFGKWDGQDLLGIPALVTNQSVNGNPVTSLLISNLFTGANSINNAVANINENANLKNSNNGSIINDLNLLANTGNNQASYNTGNGIISTGSAKVMANVLNFANTNIVAKKFLFLVVNVFGDWQGNITDKDDGQKDALTMGDQKNSNPVFLTLVGAVNKNIKGFVYGVYQEENKDPQSITGQAEAGVVAGGESKNQDPMVLGSLNLKDEDKTSKSFSNRGFFNNFLRFLVLFSFILGSSYLIVKFNNKRKVR